MKINIERHEIEMQELEKENAKLAVDVEAQTTDLRVLRKANGDFAEENFRLKKENATHAANVEYYMRQSSDWWAKYHIEKTGSVPISKSHTTEQEEMARESEAYAEENAKLKAEVATLREAVKEAMGCMEASCELDAGYTAKVARRLDKAMTAAYRTLERALATTEPAEGEQRVEDAIANGDPLDELERAMDEEEGAKQ